MITIKSCRSQLTAEDFDFVLTALSQSEKDSITLKDLLLDETTRDCILDHDKLHDSLVDSSGCIQVSSALYFYVTVRRALKKKGLNDRQIADYVASVLLAFADRRKLQKDLSRHGLPEAVAQAYPYISDILNALQKATHEQAFILRSHMGNYALFLSGLFADRVRHYRDRHGGPDIEFYEHMGQSSYHFAAQDKMAQEAKLDKLLEELSSRFHETRLALNELTDSIFHLSDPQVDLPESI